MDQKSAEASDRYGHFGGTDNGDVPQAAPEPADKDQKAEAKKVADQVMTIWAGDHDDVRAWREDLHPFGSEAFQSQVDMTDPQYIETGKVKDIGSPTEKNGMLNVPVKTTAGNYTVMVSLNQTNQEMQVEAVSADWRNK